MTSNPGVPDLPEYASIYGLVYIHKEHYPLIPVVSTVASPTYASAFLMAKLLKLRNNFESTFQVQHLQRKGI